MKYWELIMNFNLGRSSVVIRVLFDIPFFTSLQYDIANYCIVIAFVKKRSDMGGLVRMRLILKDVRWNGTKAIYFFMRKHILYQIM